MSFVKNPCPKDCPKVREQLRIASMLLYRMSLNPLLIDFNVT